MRKGTDLRLHRGRDVFVHALGLVADLLGGRLLRVRLRVAHARSASSRRRIRLGGERGGARAHLHAAPHLVGEGLTAGVGHVCMYENGGGAEKCLCVRVRGKRQVRGLGWIERVRGLFMRFGARSAWGVGRPMGNRARHRRRRHLARAMEAARRFRRRCRSAANVNGGAGNLPSMS